MNSSFLLIAVVMMGAMFMMTRSAKKKQAQAAEMRNKMEPGSGIRTIGGMYALVKAVNEDSVELEVAPGVFAIYAKNAIAVVMDGAEYNRIVHGDEVEDEAVEGDDLAEALAAEESAGTVALDKATPEATVKDDVKAEAKDATVAADESAVTESGADADKGLTAK